MKKKRILAITGIRSEYDILFPVLNALQKDDSFELGIVVSSAHLSEFHGHTINQIEKDGFDILDKIDCLFNTNRNIQRSKGVGILTLSLSQTIERYHPDFILVVGDREESIAAAIVGNYSNTLVGHIGGGDPVYGNSDDPIRMAVSKLSHLHFTTSQQYAKNLKGMGEEHFRIFFTGNPALYNIKKTPTISLKKISSHIKFEIEKNKYIIFLKHPLSSQLHNIVDQIEISLEAITDFAKINKIKIVAIRPNTDPGAYEIIKVIDRYSNNSVIKFYSTLPRNIFINLARNACALVGNSSMGILEAPTYKLPVVNIGDRQKGRLNAGNVKFVGYEKKQIMNALNEACFDLDYKKKIESIKSPYENGESHLKIKQILKDINLNDPKWATKQKLC